MDAYRIRIFFIIKPLRINSAVITLIHLQLFIYKIMQSFLLQWKWGDTTFPFSSLPRLFELFAAVKSFFFFIFNKTFSFWKMYKLYKRCIMSIKKGNCLRKCHLHLYEAEVRASFWGLLMSLFNSPRLMWMSDHPIDRDYYA